MSQMVTLICPEGAYDFPPAHGTRGYMPYRANVAASANNWRDQGGPWLVDVPIEEYTYFVQRGGFRVYEPTEGNTP